jgi:hypothetical protein
MNKTEIKECINNTIVPNGEQGITAESLNLILNEMVDNSGEPGSGGGNSPVKEFVLYLTIEDGMFPISIEELFSLEYFMEMSYPVMSEMITEMSPGTIIDECSFYKYIVDCIQNNENVIDEIKTCYKNNESFKLIIDYGFDIMIESLIMKDIGPDDMVVDYASSTMVSDCNTIGCGAKIISKEGETHVDMFLVGAIFKVMNMNNESTKEKFFMFMEQNENGEHIKEIAITDNLSEYSLSLTESTDNTNIINGLRDKNIDISQVSFKDGDVTHNNLFGVDVSSSGKGTCYFIDGLVINKLYFDTDKTTVTPIGKLLPMDE